jgi:6,7-dimethyl-8-ribityllumazine synthase
MITNKNDIKVDGKNLKICIVLPYFNDSLGLELLENAKEELIANNVLSNNIKVFRVAGALEIPFACQKIIKQNTPHAVVALGVIIKGETDHYDLVAKNTYRGIMEVQLKTRVPISFGVLACNNLEQAKQRVSKKGLNKGKYAVQAALTQSLL